MASQQFACLYFGEKKCITDRTAKICGRCSTFCSLGTSILRAFLIISWGFSSSSEKRCRRGSNASWPGTLDSARSAGSGSKLVPSNTMFFNDSDFYMSRLIPYVMPGTEAHWVACLYFSLSLPPYLSLFSCHFDKRKRLIPLFISSQVKSILFKTHLEENMNAQTWGSVALQPLVAKISITTRNTWGEKWA